MRYADLGQAEGITHQEHRKQGESSFFFMVGYERYPASSRALFYGNEKMIRPEYQFWLVSDIRRLVYQGFLHVLLAVTRMFCTTPFC